jgi:hypothetical protein
MNAWIMRSIYPIARPFLKAMTRPGVSPWWSQAIVDDGMNIEPHPVLAPLAWILCFLFGAAIWMSALWFLI